MTWLAGRRVKGMRTCAVARPTAASGTMMRTRQRMAFLSLCASVGAVPRCECDVAGRINMGKGGRQPPIPGPKRDMQNAYFDIVPWRVGHASAESGNVCVVTCGFEKGIATVAERT